MAILGDLERKTAAVRPYPILKPGAYLVAILTHENNPEHELDQQNFLWVKCPGEKKISNLLRAYAAALPESSDILLTQDSIVLNVDALVGDLRRSTSDLVILTAVEKDAVGAGVQAEINNIRQPLQEIQPNTARISNNYGSALPVGKSGEVSHFAHAAGEPGKRLKTDLALFIAGWHSFYLERREFRLSQQFDTFQAGLTSGRHVDKQVENEWCGLDATQQSYFVERSVQLNLTGKFLDHRAFWLYYMDQFAADTRLGRNPHENFESMKSYYEIKLLEWLKMPFSQYQSLKQRAVTQNPIIVMPVIPNASLTNLSSAVTDHLRQLSKQSQPQSPSRLSARNLDIPSANLPPTPISQPVSAREEGFPVIAADQGLSETESSAPAGININEAFDGLPVEQLEDGVEKGVKLLSSIRKVLESDRSAESDQWLQSVTNVEKQAQTSKTVIGVVGATGAGKSSVINAILEEERLVPTNCMRACTAVVTEISYNNEAVRYQAEIEFITKEQWEKELKYLFGDLLDSGGEISRECTNEDSEAGIAYAKLRAVYPLLSKEEIKISTAQRLLNHRNVESLLGTSRVIEHDDPVAFYKELQRYVDSKDKTSSREKKTEAEKLQAREMEYWPLIRVVRLHVKAPALATGAVIVDLPGVHDSNQARAAVAQTYLKQCTGLWIVAPITRAVDDKSAKTLLGDSFKRQLKMDGGYSSVTFICSKTDDISFTEAEDSLGLDEEMAPALARLEELRNAKQSLNQDIALLKENKADVQAAMDAADEELESWETLREAFEEGKAVYTPRELSTGNKRKKSVESQQPRKRPRYVDDSDDEFVNYQRTSMPDEGEETFSSQVEDQDEPLNEEQITEKLAELKTAKKEGRRRKVELDGEIKDLRNKLQPIRTEQDQLDSMLLAKCITGRNHYSRGAIQQDFAAGIRELDQEIAEEEDAANFNPEEDQRDYVAVADSLPVFCVSSRAYQKLQGRLKKDRNVPGFTNIDQTEIPALQQHCTRVTRANREASCRRFFNSLSQLLNSLRLWSSCDGSSSNLTAGQLQAEIKHLNAKLQKIDTALEEAVESVIASCNVELGEHILDIFPQAANIAKSQADLIQAKWGAPVDRANRPAGGLYYSTYKAVVRHEGTFSGTGGLSQFNEDLTEPIMKQIATGWEKAFTRRLPQSLANLPNTVNQLLLDFHNEVEARVLMTGVSTASVEMLRYQLPTYKENMRDAANFAKDFMATRQKDVNREFVPIILNHMLPIYAATAAECGPGCFRRMKELMSQFVESTKDSMFKESTDHVRGLLKSLMKETKEILLLKVEELLLSLKRDYQSVIGGVNVVQGQDNQLSRQQRTQRTEVLSIVDGVEAVMKSTVHDESSGGKSDGDASQGEVVAAVEPTGNDNGAGMGSTSPANVQTDVTKEKPSHNEVDNVSDLDAGVISTDINMSDENELEASTLEDTAALNLNCEAVVRSDEHVMTRENTDAPTPSISQDENAGNSFDDLFKLDLLDTIPANELDSMQD